MNWYSAQLCNFFIRSVQLLKWSFMVKTLWQVLLLLQVQRLSPTAIENGNILKFNLKTIRSGSRILVEISANSTLDQFDRNKRSPDSSEVSKIDSVYFTTLVSQSLKSSQNTSQVSMLEIVLK